MKENKDRLEITELFMAKAGRHGWDRCFHGTIRREIDAGGNPICFGRIKVLESVIYAMANDQWKLGEKLDELVLMILDMGVHANAGKTVDIAGTTFFLN